MGVMPKEDNDRVRRNAPTVDTTEVTKTSTRTYGFALPKHPNIVWCDLTKKWWNMWRKSPQAQVMIESDWWSLLAAAFIHNKIWAPGSNISPTATSNMLAELRQREHAFGATWEARQRMRMRITDEESGKDDAEMPNEEQVVNYFDNLNEQWAKENQDLRNRDRKN